MKTNKESPLKQFSKHIGNVFATGEQALARRFRHTETLVAPSPAGVEVVERELSARAFALWAQAGHPNGREWEYWDQAKQASGAELQAGKPVEVKLAALETWENEGGEIPKGPGPSAACRIKTMPLHSTRRPMR